MVIIRMKWNEVKSLSCVRLFVTPWTVAYQAPLSVGFSRQEYWSGLPFPSPGDLPKLGIEPGSPALRADALPSEPPGKLYVKYMTCSVTAGFCFGQMYYHQHVFFLNQVLVLCFVNSLFVYWVNLWPHNWSSTFSLLRITFWRMPQIFKKFLIILYIYIFIHTGLSFCLAHQVCLIVQWIKRSDDLFQSPDWYYFSWHSVVFLQNLSIKKFVNHPPSELLCLIQSVPKICNNVFLSLLCIMSLRTSKGTFPYELTSIEIHLKHTPDSLFILLRLSELCGLQWNLCSAQQTGVYFYNLLK